MKRREPLPGFLMTSEQGSFAQKTILQRKPQIIQQVIIDNDYPASIVKRLMRFKDEIVSGMIQPLTEDAPDVAQWDEVWREFDGQTWLELPWYFAEAYFYRRLLEAVGYFQPGPLQGRDPFTAPKAKLLAETVTLMSVAVEAVNNIANLRMRFESWLHASLWGNRADLSNLTVTEEVRRQQVMVERENLVINDFPVLWATLSKDYPFSHVAFINDNAGMELGFDLSLADFLLNNGWTEKVTLYLKPYPFFVSDAMPKDARKTIEAFARASAAGLNRMGKRLQAALKAGALRLSADNFWASAHHFCEMPPSIYNEISHLDMVVVKGDVNYRRLLSDRHWPPITPTKEVVSYFPAPLLILRTLKGEIIVGLREGQAERIEAEDPDWLLNGRRGIVQYIKRTP